MYNERYFKHFDLSKFVFIDDDLLQFIDQMCPTMKHVTLKGNFFQLWINQSIGDIITLFHFLTSLSLSYYTAVDTLNFLSLGPATLRGLELDFLHQVPVSDFVKYVPFLSQQLNHLYVMRNLQLTKYDLVEMLQKFWKLDLLDISESDYIEPGTCEMILCRCCNLQKF